MALAASQASAQETQNAEESKMMSAQVLSNKGVSTHGEYFRSRLSELILNNVQFVGDTED